MHSNRLICILFILVISIPSTIHINLKHNTAHANVGKRYNYELDLLIQRLEGETVEKNSKVNTPVTVFRKDFSQNREKVRTEIQRDIDRAKSELSQLESELRQLESQLTSLESELSSLESELASANRGYPEVECNWTWHVDTQAYGRYCWEYTKYDYEQINSLEGQVSEKKSQIDSKKGAIENIKYQIPRKKDEIRGFEKELNELKELEAKYETVTTDVTISFEGSEKGRRTVSLKEGESKEIIFPWVLPKDGEIAAEINLKPQRYEEIAYDNNELKTPIATVTHEIGSCGPPNREVKLKAPVMSVTTQSNGTQSYYELFTAQVNGPTPNKLRAGYGFTYDVKTTYKNEWDNRKSTPEKATATYSYTTKNVFAKKQTLDVKSNTGYTTIYHPQMYYVEEFSGIVYSSKPTKTVTPNDVILEAGRKWYSEFDQADGVYPLQIKVGKQGVNGLTLCPTSETEIQGTAMDDFIRRSVLPEDPFPAQSAGWNWKGKESILSNLKIWIYQK